MAVPLTFKARLGIGEAAYGSLTTGRALADLWHVGASAAAGGAVAGAAAAPSTFLGGLSVALGLAAATPIGWVVGGAAATGALSWGVLRLWRGYTGSRVEVVPKFINTPLDLLGATLFDLMAGLAVLVARDAGHLDEAERETIRDYFTTGWGLAPDYIAAALPLIEESTEGKSVEEVAQVLAEFKRQNPDCNYQTMSAGLIAFLTEIAEADGAVSEAEQAAIDRVRKVLDAGDRGFITGLAGSVADQVSSAGGWLWDRASGLFGGAEAEGEAEVPALVRPPVPVIWLLGKTAAGKSSLMQALTGASTAEIGNGFVPCTRTAQAFEFPATDPVLRFLDTRGLGEIAYDPAADLAEIQKSANLMLVLMRLDDPVQGMITEALAKIRKKDGKLPIVVLHTAGDLLPDPQSRDRMEQINQKAVEKAWGRALPKLRLELKDPRTADLSALHAELEQILPSVAIYLHAAEATTAEEAEFARNRALVLGYAGSATAGGALPLVGLFSVPGLQLAMLTALAKRYDVEWDRSALAKFAATLGAGVVGSQALGLGARELAKLVPVFGQTVAPVVSAGWSGAATWALGRAAGYYLYYARENRPVDEAALREIFAAALKGKNRAAD